MDKRVLEEYDVMIGKAQSAFDNYTENGYVEELEPIVKALDEYLRKLKLARYRLQGNDKEVLLYTILQEWHDGAKCQILVKGVVGEDALIINFYYRYNDAKRYARCGTLRMRDITDDLMGAGKQALCQRGFLDRDGNVNKSHIKDYVLHIYRADGTEIN